MSSFLRTPWLKGSLLKLVEKLDGSKGLAGLPDIETKGSRVQVVSFLRSTDANVRATVSDGTFSLRAIFTADAVQRASFSQSAHNSGAIVNVKKCRFVHVATTSSHFFYLVVEEFVLVGAEANATIGAPRPLNDDKDFLLLAEAALENTKRKKPSASPAKGDKAKRKHADSDSSSPLKKRSRPSTTQHAASSAKPVVAVATERHFGWGDFQLRDQECHVPGSQRLQTHMLVPEQHDPVGYVNAQVFQQHNEQDYPNDHQQLDPQQQQQQQQQQQHQDDPQHLQQPPPTRPSSPLPVLDNLMHEISEYEHDLRVHREGDEVEMNIAATSTTTVEAGLHNGFGAGQAGEPSGRDVDTSGRMESRMEGGVEMQDSVVAAAGGSNDHRHNVSVETQASQQQAYVEIVDDEEEEEGEPTVVHAFMAPVPVAGWKLPALRPTAAWIVKPEDEFRVSDDDEEEERSVDVIPLTQAESQLMSPTPAVVVAYNGDAMELDSPQAVAEMGMLTQPQDTPSGDGFVHHEASSGSRAANGIELDQEGGAYDEVVEDSQDEQEDATPPPPSSAAAQMSQKAAGGARVQRESQTEMEDESISHPAPAVEHEVIRDSEDPESEPEPDHPTYKTSTVASSAVSEAIDELEAPPRRMHNNAAPREHDEDDDIESSRSEQEDELLESSQLSLHDLGSAAATQPISPAPRSQHQHHDPHPSSPFDASSHPPYTWTEPNPSGKVASSPPRGDTGVTPSWRPEGDATPSMGTLSSAAAAAGVVLTQSEMYEEVVSSDVEAEEEQVAAAAAPLRGGDAFLTPVKNRGGRVRVVGRQQTSPSRRAVGVSETPATQVDSQIEARLGIVIPDSCARPDQNGTQQPHDDDDSMMVCVEEEEEDESESEYETAYEEMTVEVDSQGEIRSLPEGCEVVEREVVERLGVLVTPLRGGVRREVVGKGDRGRSVVVEEEEEDEEEEEEEGVKVEKVPDFVVNGVPVFDSMWRMSEAVCVWEVVRRELRRVL
ncbi:hypothetical protein HDU98_006953 [Podochytrium sp. JEL0797]|nr:hypothetical protein HDU98_006953 [Podochytrium sp. JEL0797]